MGLDEGELILKAHYCPRGVFQGCWSPFSFYAAATNQKSHLQFYRWQCCLLSWLWFIYSLGCAVCICIVKLVKLLKTDIVVSITFWVYLKSEKYQCHPCEMDRTVNNDFSLCRSSLSSPCCQASEEASLLMSSPRMLLPALGALPPGAPLSVHHQIQLLQQQLQQQQQQTQVAVAQVIHPNSNTQKLWVKCIHFYFFFVFVRKINPILPYIICQSLAHDLPPSRVMI